MMTLSVAQGHLWSQWFGMHKVCLTHSIKGWWTPSKYWSLELLTAFLQSKLVVVDIIWRTFKWTVSTQILKMVNSHSCYFWVKFSNLYREVLWVFNGSFHHPNKDSNLSFAVLLSLWVSCVVQSQLWLVLVVIWIFDKNASFFPMVSYTRMEQKSVWYPQRLWHEASNHVWSLILFLQFFFFFSSSLTVPEDQKLSLQVRNKMNHQFPLLWNNLVWLVQFSGLLQDGLNAFQINTN